MIPHSLFPRRNSGGIPQRPYGRARRRRCQRGGCSDLVRLHKDGAELGPGGPGPRTLLAVLAVRAGTVVTMNELVDALWGDRPPKTAGGGVYTYVSQLRKKLAPDQTRAARTGLLTSSRAGYCLHVPAAAVDLHRFEAAAARAREQWAAKASARTLEHCDAALAAWSGPALGGTSGPFADSERSRLDLARLDVQELRCAALLETGAAEVAAAELATLAERNPLRERLHELLMLALSRTSRQADALQAYQTVRERLIDELGIEPGPALRQMQQSSCSTPSTRSSRCSRCNRRIRPPAQHPGRPRPRNRRGSAPG